MIMIAEESMLYSPRYVQLARNGIYLLIDPLCPNWISTNKIGSEIVRMCDGRHTLRELAGKISNDYRIPFRQASEDCQTFIAALQEKEFVSQAPVLKPPYLGRSHAIAPESLEELWIYTNNDCNLSCLHCLVSASKRKATSMSASHIKGLIDQARQLGARRVYFTGGEPFLRDDILKLVEYATRHTQLVVLTNGTLLHADLARKLAEISNNNLIMQISLEGPNAKVNDRIRGSGSFERAVVGINQLSRVGIVPIVTTTVNSLNAEYLVETTEFLKSLGIRDHHILWLHFRGRGQKNLENLFVSSTQLTEVMRSLFKNCRKVGMLVDNRESFRLRAQARRGRKNDLCNSCFEMLCVDSDLQVYPCASLNGDTRFACGSLKEQTLEEIWLSSPIAQWIRENSVQKKVGCNNCYLKFFCGGGCFCQAYYNYEVEKGFGCIMAPDPYCESYMDLFEDILWELAQPTQVNSGESTDGRPQLFASMDAVLPACAASDVKVTNAAFEVAGFHCTCVLATE